MTVAHAIILRGRVNSEILGNKVRLQGNFSGRFFVTILGSSKKKARSSFKHTTSDSAYHSPGFPALKLCRRMSGPKIILLSTLLSLSKSLQVKERNDFTKTINKTAEKALDIPESPETQRLSEHFGTQSMTIIQLDMMEKRFQRSKLRHHMSFDRWNRDFRLRQGFACHFHDNCTWIDPRLRCQGAVGESSFNSFNPQVWNRLRLGST